MSILVTKIFLSSNRYWREKNFCYQKFFSLQYLFDIPFHPRIGSREKFRVMITRFAVSFLWWYFKERPSAVLTFPKCEKVGQSTEFLSLELNLLLLQNHNKWEWDSLRFKTNYFQSTCHGSAEMNLTRIYEDTGSIPGLAQWVKDLELPRANSIGHRCSSDPTLLWLWRRPAAVALIWPLAWEPLCAAGAALKSQNINK